MSTESIYCICPMQYNLQLDEGMKRQKSFRVDKLNVIPAQVSAKQNTYCDGKYAIYSFFFQLTAL